MTVRPPRLGLPYGLAVMGGVFAGLGWQLQEALLSSPVAYGGALLVGLLMASMRLAHVPSQPISRARGQPWRHALLGLLIGACVAWGWAGLRAAHRLAEVLPADLEGRDLQLVGVVASLPVERANGQRFVFEVEQARLAGRAAQPVQVPRRLSLGWYSGAGTGPHDPLQAGQRWRLIVRLKQPHGSVNPHGFDYELWLFEQGIRATGYVRAEAAGDAELLGHAVGFPVERWRQQVRDAIKARLGDVPAAGLLAALSVGDQAAIEREDWEVFRLTGIAHLVSISGLHVTMFAWLAAQLVGWVWRWRSGWALACPAVTAGRGAACLAAVGYALLAGWGVPAQRTVYMLVLANGLRMQGMRWSWPSILSLAGCVVCLIDPWALLQPGFWLSFVAVAVLMAGGELQAGGTGDDRHDANGRLPGEGARTVLRRVTFRLLQIVPGALRSQTLATVALAPLSMLFFHQASVVGMLANLLAIPLVTLLITPLALLGVLASPLWEMAAWVIGHAMAGLAVMAGWPWASWQAAVAPGWAMAAALLGLALLAAPLPLRLRGLGVGLVLPLFAPVPSGPPPGEVELIAADVGQGNAVIVRTASHSLLYDAGPQYSPENDAGTRVLVPLLRALGVDRLDLLVLSHRDSDHVGGASSVLAGVGVVRVSSSLEPGHPLRARAPHQPCVAGQRWRWDGVDFEFLHPPAAVATVGVRPNALSCVLRIVAGDRAVLLVGDIERTQELALVDARAPLRAQVLLVPHHGSKTSSTAAFIEAVAPQWAVVQAGYRNRFGHPASEVSQRFTERGINMVRTDACGAWQWYSETATGRCERDEQQRYWRARTAGLPRMSEK